MSPQARLCPPHPLQHVLDRAFGQRELLCITDAQHHIRVEHARHHDYIADPEVGRSRHLVDDEIRALGMRVMRRRASFILAPVVFTHAFRMASARGSVSERRIPSSRRQHADRCCRRNQAMQKLPCISDRRRGSSTPRPTRLGVGYT
jgi:hypothetical protein